MSSKRHKRRKMCDGKRRFSTQGEAVAAIIRLRKSRDKESRDNLLPYRCKFCRGFHFGHSPRVRGASV